MRCNRILALLLIAPLGCWSEGESGDNTFPTSSYCPPLACSDQLTIRIENADESSFEPNDYTFSISTDKIDAFLECTLSTDADLFCENDDDDIYLSINKSGKQFILRIDAAPSQIHMMIEVNNKLLHEASITPTYDPIVPADPSCEGRCLQGTVYILSEPPKPKIAGRFRCENIFSPIEQCLFQSRCNFIFFTSFS